MTTTILDRATRLYDLGLLPVLGHMSIDSDTGKKTLKFTKGWNDMTSSLDYFIAATEAYDLHPDYYNVIALHCNPKLSSIRIIDLDIIKENREESISEINELMELAKANGNPIDQTPNGGYHIFYKSEQPLFGHMPQRSYKLPTMGIDLLERSMLCIVDGSGYRKVNYMELNPNTMPSLSDEFIQAIYDGYATLSSKPIVTTSSITTATTVTSISVIEDLVKGINICEEPKIKGLGSYNNYPAYIKVLTAIYNTTSYDHDEGLRIATDFSHRIASHYGENVDKYIDETTRKWRAGWKEDKDNRITIATLYKLSDHSTDASTWMDISVDEYYAFINGRDLDEWMVEELYTDKWNNQLIAEPAILYEFLYDTQRAYKYMKHPTTYVSLDEDGEIHYSTPMNFTVMIKLTDKPKRYGYRCNNKIYSIYIEFGEYLKQYTKMGFYPNKKPGSNVINTWKGFKATILPTDQYNDSIVEPFLYHITNVICANNEKHATWLLDWFADVIQSPSNKPGTAIIFYSKANGTGKSMVFEFFINMIFGKDISCMCNGLRTILTDHNTICKDKIFINVEEAFTSKANYLEYSSQIKGLITGTDMVINPKGVDQYTVKSYFRIGTTTNHIASIPLDDTDRRFSIFEVSDKHLNDHTYFNALGTHFSDQNFADHVFTYLSNRTITSNLRRSIETDIRTKSIAICSDPLTQFTDHIIHNDYKHHYEGNILNFKEHHILSATFIEAYHHFCKTYLSTKPKSMNKSRLEGLPNNLALVKSKKQGKEYYYFEGITPPKTYQ